MTLTTGVHLGQIYSAALRGEPCLVHGLDEAPRPLPVDFWAGNVDDTDRTLLGHCHGPTLDIGCGPGRMSQHLVQRGERVLGIDVVPEAVRQTRARGAGALLRDVFAPLPWEGCWGTALLADGNIGIGGDPLRLLRRVAQLLAPGGRVVVDIAGPGSGLQTYAMSLECGGLRSDVFPWAEVGPEALADLAPQAGFAVSVVDSIDGRWFAVAERWA